ncbi:MAG: M15 family metallopeptidase [Treponema sp.]|jgi:hypothetical protein|nr:M15 family metallopeptidase [Treponema sp.]
MLPVKALCLVSLFFYVLPAFGQDGRIPDPAGASPGGTLNVRHSPEQVMRAHAAAYPQAISRVEYRKGDWAVLARGKWFYHAGGRLVPEEHLEEAESYARQSFYLYFPGLPPWKEPEGEMAERLRNALAQRRANPPKRDPEFYDTLWQAHTRDEAQANLTRISFLGKQFPVHRDLAERLKKIDALIQEEAENDPAVRRWIDSLGSIGAWNWRTVAATVSRSYHSYGAALDIQPKTLGGLATYWQWTADRNPEWYKVPYSGRWHPPLSVVGIFERYGFCWGGKWPLFDTMHFEYRPEILILYGMKVEQ